MARLGDYVIIKTGKLDANASSENGKYPFFTCAIEPLKIDSYSYDCECVLVAGNGDLNVKYYNGKFDAYQRTYIIESKNKTILTVPYLYCFLDKYVEELRKQSIGGVIKYIKLGNLTEAQIHMRSMNEQNEVVVNIKKVNDLISIRKQQLAKLDELVKARFVELFVGKEYPVISVKDLLVQNSTVEKISDTKVEKFVTVGIKGRGARQRVIKDGKWPVPFSGYRVKQGQFIYSRIDARNGAFAILPQEVDNAVVSKDFPVFDIKTDKIQPSVLLFSVLQDDFVRQIQNSSFGATNRQRIQEEVFGEYTITLPPMEIQNQFAAFVEQTDKSKLAIQKSLEKLETLKKALMQKYFG